MAKAFVDLYVLSEDERINVIGQAAMSGQTVAFITDDRAAADRYVNKLATRFPLVEVVAIGDLPVKPTVAVKVRKKPS